VGIALTQDQKDLAEAVREFTAKHAPVARTREEFARLAVGGLPGGWEALTAQGFLAIHLPESAGGDGGGVTELAVLLEETARGLVPGPLLSTVTVSLAVSRHGPAGLLPEFAAGATAGCATSPAGLRAVPGPAGGWLVTGVSAPVLGALSGRFLLLGAEGPGGDVWFVVPAATSATLAIDPAESVDLTRDVGFVTLSGHPVAAGQALDVTTDELRSLMAALFAAEAVGVARWCQEAGPAYVKVREQFGRPVGSFQAVKHKCARIFGQLEVLRPSTRASATSWSTWARPG